MKAKYLIYILFVAAMLSCKSDNEPVIEEVLPEQNIQRLTNDVKNVVDQAINCIMILDADSLSGFISKEEFEGFAGNGLNLRTHEEMHTVLKYMYAEIAASDITLSDEKYAILSDNSALYTADFTEELTDKDEQVHFSKGVFTFVLKKIDDQWMIIHMHTSSYPYKQVN